MSIVTSAEQLMGDKFIRKFKKHQQLVDELYKKKIAKRKFLQEQIIENNRIDLLMDLLGYTVEDFHLAMYYTVEHNPLVIKNRPDANQRWSLTLAGRGHGKSTVLTVVRSIMKILTNPNIRILIASKTNDNAVSFLSEIKQKLIRKDFVEVFGDHVGMPWNDGNIRVKTRTADHKEDTIQTIGIGGALPSKHYDLIIADDLVDENNSNTDGQREKLLTWFQKVLDPCLEPDGEMPVIGTRYHPEDLYGYLIDNYFTVKDDTGAVVSKHYQNFPSLVRKKNVPDTAPDEEKYVSMFPSKFSVIFLLEKWKKLGSIIFNSQYQNDIDSMSGKIFKSEMFKWFDPADIDYKDLTIFQGVDLAIKQDKDADKFAHVTIGIDNVTRNIYVLDYYLAVTPYAKQKQILKDQFFKYQPMRVAVEANGFQSALLQDMQSNPELSSIRAVPIFTEQDRYVRAWHLSAYFERGQIYLRLGMKDFKRYIMNSPNKKYKDLFDALYFAVMFSLKGQRKTRDTEPGLI